jgi:ATP-dependent exoDNAse (exonuclease V) alpha subunit
MSFSETVKPQEKPDDFAYAPEQLNAVDRISEWYHKSNKKEFKFSGVAGSGKTTVLKKVIREVFKGERIATGAMFGRAVNQMHLKGVKDARTVHSLIYDTTKDEITGRFKFTKKSTFPYDVLIVDEASTVGLEPYQDIISFAGLRVLWTGDHFQLEPVGEDPHLMRHPDVRLEEPHRYALESNIMKFATAIRHEKRLLYGNAAGLEIRTTRHFEDRIADPTIDKIIVGFNRTRHTVNNIIRLNKGHRGPIPQPTEKITCINGSREWGLFNGQSFTVLRSCMEPHYTLLDIVDESGKEYRDVRAVTEQFGVNKLDYMQAPSIRYHQAVQFDYDYAGTNHKCQGGGWGKVLVKQELHRDWNPYRWGYTASTRAADHLVYCF